MPRYHPRPSEVRMADLRERYLRGHISEEEYEEGRTRIAAEFRDKIDLPSIYLDSHEFIDHMEELGNVAMDSLYVRRLREMEYERKRGIISHDEFVRRYKKTKREYNEAKERTPEVYQGYRDALDGGSWREYTPEEAMAQRTANGVFMGFVTAVMFGGITNIMINQGGLMPYTDPLLKNLVTGGVAVLSWLFGYGCGRMYALD
jgi:hypothetical protein